jgi:pyruvate dehydrogenase E1 component beta subunit
MTTEREEAMSPDVWALYRQMLRSRLFELAVRQLWLDGDISGEMHLGIGEEGIAAGVVSQLIDGDAMALDHRGTPQLLMRGVGVHRSLEAAERLEKRGVSAGVLDLRTVSPLDKETVCEAISQTCNLLVVDEDYEGFGLSGELAAVVLEAGISARYARVCTRTTIPYARRLEDEALPTVEQIVSAALRLVED